MKTQTVLKSVRLPVALVEVLQGRALESGSDFSDELRRVLVYGLGEDSRAADEFKKELAKLRRDVFGPPIKWDDV